MSECLPTDPQLGRNEGWDAMKDSLWGGLRNVPGDRVAIVWADSRKLAQTDPGARRVASEILLVTDVAAPSGLQGPGSGHRKELLVLLA